MEKEFVYKFLSMVEILVSSDNVKFFKLLTPGGRRLRSVSVIKSKNGHLRW